MYAAGFLSGAAPVIKRYMAGTTIARAGIPLLASIAVATDLASAEPMAASTPVIPASMIGLSLSPSGTIAATGMTSDAALFTEVIVNPDLIYGARANAGTTSGTALATVAAGAASAGGTTITATTIADGAVYGVSGANATSFRRAVDTSGAVSINFVRGVVTTDFYLAIHGFPCLNAATNFISYDLTTDLTEVIAQTSVVDMDNFATLDIVFDPLEPATKTKYLLVANNSLFGSSSGA